jgi:prolyl-tRNA editing enzyme YbaK/EbsC (Cys-tRNA(Pro) deacylase)
MSDLLEHEGVKRVRAALDAAKHPTDVLTLKDSARTAGGLARAERTTKDAARAVGCEQGAIVKSLVFMVENRFVLVLVAGDRVCLPENLPRALDLDGPVRMAEAGEVRFATGFAIGAVAPVGLSRKLPCVLDRSLKRFETVFAAAGHPNCVFPTTVEWLKELTGAIVSYNISAEENAPGAIAAAKK